MRPPDPKREDEDAGDLVDRLTALRCDAGITQSELSRLAQIERTYVGKLEGRAFTDVGLRRLIGLTFVLGCSLDWAVFGLGKKPKPEQVRAAVDRSRRNPAAVRAEIERALGQLLERARPVSTKGRAKALPRRPRTTRPPRPEARS